MEPYTETQRFDQWWIKAILAIPLFETLAFMLNDYQSSGDIGTKALLGFGTIVCVIILFYAMNLTTKVDEHGINFRFFPFHLKSIHLSWDEIDSAIIREYSPLSEYGGWGLRFSFGNGKAYNVKGKIGLQLVLKNGKKILIGTSNRQKLENYLHDLKTQYKIASIQ